jgi:hypothetical protein
MTVTIELPEESAALLRDQAAAHGLSLAAWIEQLARDSAGRSQGQPAGPTSKNLVELFAPLRGLNLDFDRNRSTGRTVDL